MSINLGLQAQSKLELELKNWKMRQVGNVKPIALDWIEAKIPGCVHTDLLYNKLIEDPFYRTNERTLQWIDKANWEYKTTFLVDQKMLSKNNISLVFKGLDTYADVYLNETLVLSANNMFREWQVDVEKILTEGNNTLRILFHSPIQKGLVELAKLGYDLPAINDQSENGELGKSAVSIFTRKAGYHYGWDWGPRFVTSGIWRPVFIKAWDNIKIENVQYVQNQITTSKALLTGKVELNASKAQKVTIKIKDENSNTVLVTSEVSLKEGLNTVSTDFQIAKPKLWWSRGLGEAYLYKLKLEVSTNNTLEDVNIDRIGLRTLKLIQNKDEKGTSFYFELNGVPVFCKGANYIPNDNFLDRVTVDIYRKVVKSAVDANMNMLRVWGGGIYENDIFYDLCDENGILLWQDFMFACSMYPGDEPFLENVKQEAIQNVKRLRNHPSIALWCGNNEIDAAWAHYEEKSGWGWKQKFSPELRDKIYKDYEKVFHAILPSIVKEFDSRPYWPSSPLQKHVDSKERHSTYSATSGDMHYWDVWHGKKPFEDFFKAIPRFMSEYGFQSFPEFKTVKKYTIPSDWDITSDVMASHQRSGIGNLRIKEYTEWYYKLPKDFENFLYVGQVLQAEGMKIGFEAHRRSMPYCMGSLFWQINDCWPVASWSSIDYYGNWKALHYFAKKAYEDILVSPVIENNKFKVFLVSDLLKEVSGNLQVSVVDFSGKSKYEKTLPIKLKANSSKVYFEEDLPNFISKFDTTNAVVRLKFTAGNNRISQNVFYFSKAKNLKLTKPKFDFDIAKTDNGFDILLKTDVLAKNVFLSTNRAEGFFSDNYFDLIPGNPVKVSFITTSSLEDFSKDLSIISLFDSY